MQAKTILVAIAVVLLSSFGFCAKGGETTREDSPVLASLSDRDEHLETPDSVEEIVFNLTYDTSSLDKIFADPASVIGDVTGFWEGEDAYRLLKSWHRYNNIPIDYDGWKQSVERVASIPMDERKQSPGYLLAIDIIGAKEAFFEKAVPHICSFLPARDLAISATAYFVAFTQSRAIGVGDRIAIDIFNPYFGGSKSTILNSMIHELYHVGFGHVQFGRTDPEFESPAVRRMLTDFQNEGITTYVAYKAQEYFPAPHEKDYSMLDDEEVVFKLLKKLNELLKEAASLPADRLAKESWDLGVENRAYYVVGAHMARTIDEKKGRDALKETIEKGPVTFIETYNRIVGGEMRVHKPEAPADTSVLERLRQAAMSKDYQEYELTLAELRAGRIDVDRSKEEILLKIGLVFMQRKRSDLAIDILALDAALFPESAPAYNFLGKAHLQNGDNQRARENFEKSVALDPEYVDAAENLRALQELE